MRILLFISLLLGTSFAKGQNFNFQYGGSTADWGIDVVETYDRGYAILSTLDGQYARILLTKIDVNGAVLWKKIIGNVNDKIAPMSLIQTSDNGYLITGVEHKYDPPPPGGNSFAMKLNECGEIEWARSYGSYGNYDYINGAVQTDDKGYTLLANYIDNKRIVLLKIDSIGRLEFKKHFFDTSNATGKSLKKCMNGDFIFSGYGYFPNPGGVPAGWWQRSIVTRVDKFGNEKWSHILGLDTLLFCTEPYCIEQMDSTLLCGSTWRKQGAPTITKPYMFKLDKAGNVLWRRFVGDTAWFDSDVNGIVYTDTNKIFLLSGRLCDPVYHGVFLYRTDTSGIFQDSVGYDYDHYCWTGDLKATSEHKLIYCGTLENGGNYQAQLIRIREDLSIDTVLNISLNYDSLCGHVIPAIEYLPFDTSYHIGIEEVVKEELDWLLYPNPANDVLNIKSDELDGVGEAKIYNVLGELVLSKEIEVQTNNESLNIAMLEKGFYILKLSNRRNNRIYSKTFIKN